MKSSHEEPLDYGQIADIAKSKELFERQAQFHWDYYSELAFLRNQIYDDLKSSLRDRAGPFALSGWQRAVKFKYSLAPLSTKGSLAEPGGRFNIGAIDSRFPVFPALYLASDKKTAFAELLGRDQDTNGLTPEELALTKPTSVTIVSVSGKLEFVLDVRDPKNLAGFVNMIKDFRVSSKLLAKARNVGLSIKTVRTAHELANELQSSRWREWPSGYDVPGAPQIFGRIVMDAGIEGVLYDSVLTHSLCAAIYPQNFQNSSSYIELDDPCPPEAAHKRIDSATFKNFI
jgi:RES domain-containing protein